MVDRESNAAGEVMKGITQSQSEIRMAYGIDGEERAPEGRSTAGGDAS